MSLGSQPPTPGSHTAQLSVPNWCGLLLMKMATFWRERERRVKTLCLCLELNFAAEKLQVRTTASSYEAAQQGKKPQVQWV